MQLELENSLQSSEMLSIQSAKFKQQEHLRKQIMKEKQNTILKKDEEYKQKLLLIRQNEIQRNQLDEGSIDNKLRSITERSRLLSSKRKIS